MKKNKFVDLLHEKMENLLRGRIKFNEFVDETWHEKNIIRHVNYVTNKKC